MDTSDTEKKEEGSLREFFDKNFIEYATYNIRDRAIPSIDDGLKPVQRRILQTLANMDDGRFNKVANVVGETMRLHPHGDASIYEALVNLANKGYLVDRQGNFGNIFTGDGASAARYIECRLSPLAKETLFNPELTEYIDSYDGRLKEPVTLPAKLPMLLMMGAEGIAVGMATKILPHNFCELLRAEQSVLREEKIVLLPDFPQGGLMDASNYDNGNGKIRCRARIQEADEKTILIKEIPYGLTTQKLTDSIEKAAKQNKIKITSINDYTAENVEIEIKVARGVKASETIKGLYAFTDCEISITPNLTLINGDEPQVSSVAKVIRHNAFKLRKDLEKELRFALGHLEDKLHARLLEQIFIEERVYKRIEEEKTPENILAAVREGLKPFLKELRREVTADDINRLLEIRIKRISRYDIEKQAKEIQEIRDGIKKIKKDLQDMTGYSINFLEELIKRYGKEYPRKTECTSFAEINLKNAAIANLTVVYSRENGFIGSQVKLQNRSEDIAVNCSEYDKLFLLFKNGLYKFVSVTDKIYVGKDLEWFGVVNKEELFNVIYRDGVENFAYVKRFTTPSFILEKEYRLFTEHRNSKVLLLSFGEKKYAKVHLVPSSRARSNSVEIDFDNYLVKNASAKGKRIATRRVRKVVEVSALNQAEGSDESEQEKQVSLPFQTSKDKSD